VDRIFRTIPYQHCDRQYEHLFPDSAQLEPARLLYWQSFGSARGSVAGVDMAVACQVSHTLRVFTVVSSSPQSSFIDRSGGTMF
jgi:hypothetical protein